MLGGEPLEMAHRESRAFGELGGTDVLVDAVGPFLGHGESSSTIWIRVPIQRMTLTAMELPRAR